MFQSVDELIGMVSVALNCTKILCEGAFHTESLTIMKEKVNIYCATGKFDGFLLMMVLN